MSGEVAMVDVGADVHANTTAQDDVAKAPRVVEDTRRKWLVLGLTGLLFVGELFLAYWSYDDVYNYAPPLIAFSSAVIGFTVIDFLARPEKREYTTTLMPRWYRRYLPFWCLVPFITALGGSVWVHYQKWCDARADIWQLAHEVKAAVEWPDDGKPDPSIKLSKRDHQAPPRGVDENPISVVMDDRGWFAADSATNECWKEAHRRSEWAMTHLVADDDPSGFKAVFSNFMPAWRIKQLAEAIGTPAIWRCFTTERINAKVATLVTSRYGADKGTPEAIRFAEIARVVGHDVLIAHGDIDVVCRDIMLDTGGSFALALAIQALFIFWIPALLAVTIARAQKRTRGEHTQQQVQRSIDLRDHQILAEDAYLFLPRMCFAILLVLGTNYVFAPLGLKATYIMSIVDEHALPGHTTFILWSTSFSQAPVIVVGFVGFLIYALITATQRFALNDFDDRALLSLLVRGLVVILLSFALSSSEINEVASRTFVFIAGVFPVRALEAIAKRFNVSVDPDLSSDDTPNFAGLPGLDPVKVFALRAAGIQSTYDLAAMNIEDVAERVRIDPRLLGRAVDRAILIDALGLDLALKLSCYGITSATELVDLDKPEQLLLHGTSPSDEAIVLCGAATAAKARLAPDSRVKTVRGWLATRS